MKKVSFLMLVMAAILLFACGKEEINTCDSTATVIGADLTLCGCCGGMFVEVDGGDTIRITSGEPVSVYESLLEVESGEEIQLTWEAGTPCLGDEQKITCLEISTP